MWPTAKHHLAGPPPPAFLKLREAAAYCDLSPDTLRRAIKAGKLHASGGGRFPGGPAILIRIADLDNWLEQR